MPTKRRRRNNQMELARIRIIIGLIDTAVRLIFLFWC